MGVQHVQDTLGTPGAYAPGGSSTGSCRMNTTTHSHKPLTVKRGHVNDKWVMTSHSRKYRSKGRYLSRYWGLGTACIQGSLSSATESKAFNFGLTPGLKEAYLPEIVALVYLA
jgi:hypothetical protein